MLAVFENSVVNPPPELKLLSSTSKTRQSVAESFRSKSPESTFFNLPNGNFICLPPVERLKYPRSMIVVDNIYCVFMGTLENTCDMRRHYGLSRQANEAMIVAEAYKVLRDRAPYPPDQVVKDMEGKFAFLLFDAKCGTFFAARDRDGFVRLEWGIAGDGSLVCSDDAEIVEEACGNSRAVFPAGCIFITGKGLMSFDHPLHKIRAIAVEDDDGGVRAVRFQVDMFTRLQSIPRTGSESNWAGAAVVEGEYRV